MGNCIVSVNDRTEVKHEFFNEHNDRYFARVQARNSTLPSKKPWKLGIGGRNRDARLEDEDDTSFVDQPLSVATQSTISQLPSSTRSSPATTRPEGEESASMAVSTPWKSSDLSNMDASAFSPFSAYSSASRHVSQQFGPPLRIQTDAATDGWQVKRKGHALRLRLAKNRFLQMAASGDALSPNTSRPLSPITLDSDVQSKAKPSHDWNTEFETKGMVWVEVNRNIPVTALAMSRSRPVGNMPSRIQSLSNISKATHRPLLIAVGDEQGMVTVTEIIDEHRPLIAASTKPENAPKQNLRKFGETLEFPIQGRIRSMDFSPDDRYLVVAGDGCVAVILLIVLDSDSNELRDLRILQQLERVDRIYSVQFHPSSSQISMAGFDGKVAIGSIEDILSSSCSATMREISRFGLIYCFDWSPAGEHFAVGGSDKACAIYNVDGNLLHEMIRKTAVQTLQWNHDGSFLAVGDREVAIVDGRNFHLKCEISNAPDDSPTNISSRYRIEALCWSPDGSFLAIGGSDGICLVVETKGYALVHEVHRTARIICLSWGERSSNQECSRYLAISDEGCNVALVKAGIDAEGSEADELSSAASSSYFSTGSDWVLREDCFRDMDDASLAVELSPRDIKPQGNISSLVFSRSNKSRASAYLAYSADDCSLTIMTTRDWKAVFQMEFAKPLRALAFSHSNNFLALGGDEGVLYVLSVPSRSIIFNTIFNAAITTVAFSHHDERLSVGSMDGVLTLLCPDADWEPVGELDFSESPILAQDWSSKVLAVGREDGSVAIFDTEKAFGNFFVPLAEFSHSLPVRTLAFGTSGRLLAIGGDSGVLSILSSKGSWALCQQFKMGERVNILSAQWSPAGRYLVFGGSQEIVCVLDTITWMEAPHIPRARLFKDCTAIASIDWSVDGKWVALGSAGGGIHVLNTAAGWQLLVPTRDRLRLSSEDDEDAT